MQVSFPTRPANIAAELSREAGARPEQAPYVLQSVTDIGELHQTIPLLGFGPRRRVRLQVATLTAARRTRWEWRINLWLNACGCQVGALLALGAVVWRTSVAIGAPPPSWAAAAIHAAWVLGAAVLGKLGGLLLARVLLVLDLVWLKRFMLRQPHTSLVVRP